MTKEECIGKYPIVCNNEGTKLYLERDDVLKAMDVYAKQQAIAFDKWKWDNRWWSFENGKWHYTFEHGTYISKKTLEKNYQKTTQELYNQFIEQQNKSNGNKV